MVDVVPRLESLGAGSVGVEDRLVANIIRVSRPNDFDTAVH
jgi:hypothetical protein